MPTFPRPRLCPERTCRPVYQVPYPDALVDDPDYQLREEAPGESWSCWGKRERTVTFVYDGVEHINDTNSCHFTPLKGLIQFQENADDWMVLEHAYHAALKGLDIGHGDRCVTGREIAEGED